MKLSLNAIGGPCTSYELVAHDQTEVVFCGDDLNTIQYLKEVMQTDYYHISITTDVTGIESGESDKIKYLKGNFERGRLPVAVAHRRNTVR